MGRFNLKEAGLAVMCLAISCWCVTYLCRPSAGGLAGSVILALLTSTSVGIAILTKRAVLSLALGILVSSAMLFAAAYVRSG